MPVLYHVFDIETFFDELDEACIKNELCEK